MSLVRTRVMESRPYDAYFDPVFSSSPSPSYTHAYRSAPQPAWTNLYNEARQTAQGSANKQTRKAFKQTQLNNTIPALMPDGTIGRIAAPSSTAHVPRVIGADGPLTPAQIAQQLPTEILGRSRVKFFKRPVIPFLAASAEQQGVFDPSVDVAHTGEVDASAAAPSVEDAQRTFGTQTDYRESETQTDPYSPDYITSPDEPSPEILGLAHLRYGAGLPASMSELTLIERIRDKQAFEASLPPITDANSFEIRKKMLEERELKEWKIREEEMKQEQEDRLQMLIMNLQEREAASAALCEARVDAVRQEKIDERDRMFDAIHRDRIKLHRALAKTRHELEENTAHMSGGFKEQTSSKVTNRRTSMRDIVQDYADYSSQVYAPIAREGRLPVKNGVVDYGIPLISNYQGLVDLERHLSHHSMHVAIPKPAQQIKSLQTRKSMQIANDLAYVDKLLHSKKDEKPTIIENVYKKFEPVQRAPTPSVVAPSASDSERAILLLQRLLRGRMVQNAMYEGKQHHAHLIQELRGGEQFQPQQQSEEEESLTQALDTLQGELISNALDFVSKEIVRLEEENKIAALVKMARLTRRHREAEESGRRQAEEALRNKQERQMQETLADHSLTASRYLSELLSNAVDRYSSEEASHDSSLHSEQISPIMAELERSENSTEQIVADLVNTFLLQEVERRKAERHDELRDRRFFAQAHEAVLGAFAKILPPTS